MSEMLSSFTIEGQPLNVVFIESVDVATGVRCDVYKFQGDSKKDVGKIYIETGCHTPLQRVLNGDSTIEEFVSGRGTLTIIKPNGEKVDYNVEQGCRFFQEVKVGEVMQWQAALDSELVVYEICTPPYHNGRFENLPETRV